VLNNLRFYINLTINNLNIGMLLKRLSELAIIIANIITTTVFLGEIYLNISIHWNRLIRSYQSKLSQSFSRLVKPQNTI